MTGWENTLSARIARRENKWRLRAKFRKQFPKPHFPDESKHPASPRATARTQIPTKDPILHAEQSSPQTRPATLTASPATTTQTREVPAIATGLAMSSPAPKSPTGAVTLKPKL